MPWVGVCRTCNHFEIEPYLGSINSRLRQHIFQQHKETGVISFPTDMNTKIEVDVSSNGTGFYWTSEQFVGDKIWIAVITRSDASYFRYRIKEEKPEMIISYLKTMYEAPIK